MPDIHSYPRSEPLIIVTQGLGVSEVCAQCTADRDMEWELTWEIPIYPRQISYAVGIDLSQVVKYLASAYRLLPYLLKHEVFGRPIALSGYKATFSNAHTRAPYKTSESTDSGNLVDENAQR